MFKKIALFTSLCLFSLNYAHAYDQVNKENNSSAEIKKLDYNYSNLSKLSINTNIIKGKDFFYISPIVSLENKDIFGKYITLKENSLSVTRVVAKKDKIISLDQYHPRYYSSVGQSGNAPIENIFIPKGGTRTINYLVQVDSPGMYYITFTADGLKNKDSYVENFSNGLPMKIFVSKYVYVK